MLTQLPIRLRSATRVARARESLAPRCGTRVLLALSVALAPIAHAQRGDAFDTRILSPDEQRALFQVPPGFEVQLVAAEPDIQKPMNLAFDAAGRVWVTGSALYPWPARRDALGEVIPSFQKHWDENHIAFRAGTMPPEPPDHGTDSVRILSDFDPATGRARRVTVFADKLNIPIGVLPLPQAPGDKGDTALVFSIPAIWKLTDTDGDGRADRREKLYDGFGFKDTHGLSSSYWLWYDGWVYGTHGFSNRSEIRDGAGRTTVMVSGNTYRFRPDGSRFELYVHGQTNPFGLAFDARGNLYTADSHSKPVYLLIPGGYYEGTNREHDGLGFAPAITTDDHGSSAIAGLAHYSATHFPPEFRDNLFNGNPVTRRVNRARLEWRGSSPHAMRERDFVTSEDRAFRPVQVKLGPDGALWIADFYNPIIGHYEVPLNHPARDRTHGRVWRVVWRGLDNSVAPPVLPNLARDATTALVARLTDPNVVLRSLAISELLVRGDASSAVPPIHAAATRLIHGATPSADGTTALPLLMALERLGRMDEALLRRALARPESDVALAALRVLAARDRLPDDAEQIFRAVVNASSADAGAHVAVPADAWRVMADILRAHPRAWAAPLLITMLERTPSADFELVYALRLALKAQALTADARTLHAWSEQSKTAAELVADVYLAVPTPAAAEFLLGHLERTKFASARSPEFARHAVQQLPDSRLTEILPLLRSLDHAALEKRLTLAEGIAAIAAQPSRRVPAEADSWMRHVLLTALRAEDPAPVLRAANAVRPIAMPEKAAPLRLVATTSARDNVRLAAIRALDPDDTGTEGTLVAVLQGQGTPLLRRTAAELLGTPKTSGPTRAAMAATLANSAPDLTLAIVHALAKSDDGAAELLALVGKGKVKPELLRHRYLTLAFEQRSPALRARAEELTRHVASESARLDALIAQRVAAAARVKSDAGRGAAVYAMHCAACHRYKETGGNLGPSLDGIGSRGLSQVIEDILDPSRAIDPAFQLTSLTLKNGETKAGMNLREQGDRILLAEPGTGQDFTIARADIADRTTSPVSPMPAAFDTLLSEQELFDLVAYLRGSGK